MESLLTSWNVWKMLFHSRKIFQITGTEMFRKCCQHEMHSFKNSLAYTRFQGVDAAKNLSNLP